MCELHCKLLTHLWCFLADNFHQMTLQERYLLQLYSEQHQTYLQGCFLTWNSLKMFGSVSKHVKISRQTNGTGASTTHWICATKTNAGRLRAHFQDGGWQTGENIKHTVGVGVVYVSFNYIVRDSYLLHSLIFTAIVAAITAKSNLQTKM